MAIWVVALLGLLWRVRYTLDQFSGDTNLFDEGDAFLYSTVAHNTARGHWFVNPFNGTHFADHPPLTVVSLTPTGWLFPDSVMAQRMTTVVLGSLAVVLIGLLGRRVAGPVAGVLAAVAAAANPNLWMNDALVMSETISALLIAALMWAGVELGRSPTRRQAAITGALCGLTVLARAEIGLFLPLMIAPAIALARAIPWKERLLRMVIAGLCTLAVMAPWTIWNATKFSEAVLISTNDGTTLLGSNCDTVYNTRVVGAWKIDCVVDFNQREGVEAQGLDASEVSVLQRQEAVHYIRDNTGRLPSVIAARVARTFGFSYVEQQVYLNMGEGRPTWASHAGYRTFWVLAPIAAIGAWRMRRRVTDLVPFGAAAATVLLVSVLFYGIARFRLPLDIATCVLAAVAVAGAIEKWGPERLRRLAGLPDPPPRHRDDL